MTYWFSASADLLFKLWVFAGSFADVTCYVQLRNHLHFIDGTMRSIYCLSNDVSLPFIIENACFTFWLVLLHLYWGEDELIVASLGKKGTRKFVFKSSNLEGRNADPSTKTGLEWAQLLAEPIQI